MTESESRAPFLWNTLYPMGIPKKPGSDPPKNRNIKLIN